MKKKLKNQKTSQRGYIIRFYDEEQNKPYYLSKTYSRYSLEGDIGRADIYPTYQEAESKKLEAAREVKANKRNRKKGYFYISKIFYKEDHNKWGTRRVDRADIRLTKPDKHDFLHSI